MRTKPVVLRVYNALLCPCCHLLVLRLHHMMKAQSIPSWSKAAMSFLIPACCYHRRKTEPEVSRCQGPAFPDFNRCLVTLGRWTHRTSVFSSRTVHFLRLAFWLWRGSFSDHSFHTRDSNHLQLKGFIWHKIQYGCGDTKLQRQRKEKEPWFYLIRNEQEVTKGVTNWYALRESFLMPIPERKNNSPH